MSIAIFGTIFLYHDFGQPLHNTIWILAALLLGTIVGSRKAQTVQMTEMPQMVSIFNGMGGACAALIGIVEIHHIHEGDAKVLPSRLNRTLSTINP